MKELKDLLFHDTKCSEYKADFHIICYIWFSFLCLIDLKLLSNDIGHLRNIKEEVDLKKKQLDEASNRMNVNRDQIDKYSRKLDPITERLNMINAREADITKLYTEKGMYIYICLPVEFINVSSYSEKLKEFGNKLLRRIMLMWLLGLCTMWIWALLLMFWR
jgi:hypothetical protein